MRNAALWHALTVNEGFSIGDAVLDSATVVDENSTASSLSSARTWPRRVAEEKIAVAINRFRCILSICKPKQVTLVRVLGWQTESYSETLGGVRKSAI